MMLKRSPNPQIDRRQHARIDSHCEFRLRALGEEFSLQTTNLSFGGAFFESTLTFPLGTGITIELKGQNQSAKTRAQVIHHGSNGFGVAFIDPEDDFNYLVIATICEHIGQNIECGATADHVPGRIALIVHNDDGDRVLYTAGLNPNGVWIAADETHQFADTLQLTLPEHGVFDCQAHVIWRTESALGLEFIGPSEEFRAAFRRTLNAFLPRF